MTCPHRVERTDQIRWPDLVPAGGMVVWAQAGAEPLTLTQSLMDARHEIGGFRAGIGLVLSDAASPQHADCVDFVSYTGGARNRALAEAGALDILPVPYGQFSDALSPVDVLLLHLPLAGSDGRHGLGLAAEYIADLLPRARLVVAEINDRLPDSQGPRIDPAQLHITLATSRPVQVMPDGRASTTDRAIAARVAALVEDGATLQLGIGKLPEAICNALADRRDLGVHSGTIGDGIAALAEGGVLTNARKTIDPGVTVTGAIMGGERVNAWADRNPALRLAPTSYTHDPGVLSRIDRLTAINSAIEVDLTGQINAEVAGGVYVGAVGGAGDFLRAAARSRGGLPIVALPASLPARGGDRGASRIVARLSGPVSTARADAGIIVTEHGVADLRGRSLRERRQLMLDIAAPEWRAALDETPAGNLP